MTEQPPLLLTVGEPAGIGPDCLLLLWQQQPELFDGVVVIAPPHWLRERARSLNIPAPIHTLPGLDAPRRPETICCHTPQEIAGEESPVVPGTPATATAHAVIACIRQAAEACLRGDARAVVTGPIEKAVLRGAGFPFPGHTEFLAALCHDSPVVMMLANDELRVALLTTHLPLRAVPDALDPERIVRDATILHRALRDRFAIPRPRLALCALNPHAGEQGHFGDEEQRILMPAVARLREDGIDVSGPLAADSLFAPRQRKHYDAILCCYHDQALIPLKMLGFGRSINISLGLPIIRTSVDHGTALTLAGSGKADPGSLRCAIETAKAMASHDHAATT